MKKKKLTEREEQDNNKATTIEGLNQELRRYLVRLGWNNPNTQNDFISVINSFILSGENPSLQNMITTYLKKGLDVLNLEMNKQDLMTKQSVSRVESEDVADDSEEINESLIKNANRKRNMRLQKKSRLLDNLTEIRKNLIDSGFNIRESAELVNVAFRTKDPLNVLRSMTRLSENENPNEREVYKTNFNTFYKLYLTNTYDWATDPLMNVLGTIVSFVEKGANDANTQTQIVLKLEDLQKLLKNNIKSFNGKVEESKNLEVAQSELRKYAVVVNAWSQEDFSKMFSIINDLVVNSRNVNIQRRISQKLAEIDSAITKKTEEKEEQPEKKEQPKVQEEPKKQEKPKEVEKTDSEDTDDKSGSKSTQQ